ncbi:MAG: RNA methyltransferase [Bacteroides sp.]|nr:RNA methyltransferase [Bacteroides sp.]MCM1379328.1 RNA methyltransferase [Bacteroides sp.]MCM1445013.1 RNA methyltransferase [Prevotella sp.]
MTAAEIKKVCALASAKGRREAGAFLAEGTRCVVDSLPYFELLKLYCTSAWAAEHPTESRGAEIVDRRDIERMSQQQSPQPVLAVFALPDIPTYSYDGDMALALDAVQDPGNLGTIIRLADWFGIRHILAGAGTADAFQPKVVQATMGALARVCVHKVSDLADTLRSSGTPIIGTFLNGDNLYDAQLTLDPKPIIVMGNEGNGISPAVEATVSYRLKIPSFPPGRKTSESLNVAMATGIIISELSRQIYGKAKL